jgi:putative ABC transport system permease protein
MDRLRLDLRDAWRRVVRERGFAAMAVVTLGLGIGANTAIFSLIRAVILQPLPYGEPVSVVMVWKTNEPGEVTHLSVQEVTSYRQEASTLQGLAAYTETDANFTGGQEPERVRVAAVTPDLFALLRVDATIGRPFVEAEGTAGQDAVVVLGHGLWQRRFGGDPAVIGQSVQMNGRARVIVGVMPARFHLPTDYRSLRPTEAWIPLVIDPANLGQWGSRSLFGVARLRPGVDADAASSEFAVISRRWIQAGFVADQGDGLLARSAVPAQVFVTGDVRTPLFILLGAVVAVLLIACANLANLLLAKADVRGREVAIRAALGASRARLVRQSLTESGLVALLGGIAGLGLARTALRLLAALNPPNLPRVDQVALDGSMLMFATGLAAMTGVLVGLLPALQHSRSDLVARLNEGGRSGTIGRARQTLRRALVVVQVAGSVLLAIGAGLLVRSFVELNRIDLGFDADRVLTAEIQLPQPDYPQPTDVVRFYREVTGRLQQAPGVESAGAVRILPLTRTIGDWSITLEGRPHVREENPNADFQAVTPGYLTAMGLRLVRGRLLTEADREDAPLVAVINETMAARYWPGDEALGKRFHMNTDDRPWMTIVGIVRTVRHNAVVEPPRAEMYIPHAQLPIEVGSAPRGMTLVVKTAADPIAMAGTIRQAVRELDSRLPVSAIRTMESVTAAALSRPRFTTLLLGLFAALALVLAALGIYGTISLLVAERSQEIGIRMALGAGRRTILSMVLGQGLALAAIGAGVGLAGAVALRRVLANVLYGVSSLDPLTFAVVPAMLGAVALFACLFPARRAAATDPVHTLRGRV